MKIGYSKRKLVFQPSFSRTYVSFREGIQTIPLIDSLMKYLCFVSLGAFWLVLQGVKQLSSLFEKQGDG